MALASNVKEQLAKRLKANIELREPTWTVNLSATTALDPFLEIKNGATVLAKCVISRRSFSGFNVVAELSSSAAEGLPEHVAYVLVNTAQSQTVVAKISMMIKELGTSSVKEGFKAVPIVEGDFIDSNVAFEIANDARLGAVGQ